MRLPLACAIYALLASAPASSEVLYARPEGTAASAPYRWADEVVTRSIPLSEAIGIARAADGTRALEIRLLHRADMWETIYTLDLGSVRSALRWHGSDSRRLTIRGQTDASGAHRRALTIIVGQRSLRETLCAPNGFDLCAAGTQHAADRREDLLDYLARELEGHEAVPARDIRLRLNCLLIWDSAFVEITGLGFRDCWLAAVGSYASSNIALRDSVIEGSSYAFAALPRKARPETAHSFEITGNVWKQSPSTYRSPATACDIHNDWSCPVSVWSDVPWGIVHHHFWSPLNGALFAAMDILGNVRIADNYLVDAYNGIRVKVSYDCLARPACRERTNAGFEITGNTFEKIRDNPIEPEGQAAFWIVKHNTFINVYAAISTDGVAGHDFLVFGNVFALDDPPGATCRDGAWAGSRQFRPSLDGGGRWSTDVAQEDDASCSTHLLGTVIKLGGADDKASDSPLLKRIHFFNNSIRTRSPLFRGSPAAPITSYNNAVQFTGCARYGPLPCRQETELDPTCTGTDVWTSDGQALYAKCFALDYRDGRPLPHVMRFNAYDRAPGPEVDQIDRDRVDAGSVSFHDTNVATRSLGPSERALSIDASRPLARAGCTLIYADADLSCVGRQGPVGAVIANGARFDLDLPFRFPFVEVLRAVNSGPPVLK